MNRQTVFVEKLKNIFKDKIESLVHQHGEVIMTVPAKQIIQICDTLKTHEDLRFEMLMDLCGVDYLHYGVGEWETAGATSRGFERAVQPISSVHPNSNWTKPRLAVVYHLLSISLNHRITVKAFVQDENPIIDSVVSVWNSANWYEREAFDLYGILFNGHPDLRRILTDYGFIGHPFRKDFPLIGHVCVRYDAKAQRVVYEPVDIEPRILVPKVIREENVVDEGENHG